MISAAARAMKAGEGGSADGREELPDAGVDATEVAGAGGHS
jgi:hypothetical protein